MGNKTATTKGACLSNCNKYRYWLSRTWDNAKPQVVFVGLNPSTADDRIDDPTIKRCIAYGQSWGYGGFLMLNLFAYRSTDPEKLKKVQDPVGEQNNYWIKGMITNLSTPLIVACWGNGINDARFTNRTKEVTTLLKELGDIHCIQLNKATGQPAHPLYLKADLRPILMSQEVAR